MTDHARAIEAGARADLLPCPFCGGSDLVLDKNGYKTKWVICDGCGATIDDNPHGDCVDLWNTRAIASGALVPASAGNTTLATSATNRIAKVVGMSPEIRDDVHGIIQEALAGLAPASGDYVVGWRDISTDRTPILAKFFDDIYPRIEPQRPDLESWNGLQVVIRHPGIPDSGFDIGWSVAAPVGNGGLPDRWIEGWMPMPLNAASSNGGGK